MGTQRLVDQPTDSPSLLARLIPPRVANFLGLKLPPRSPANRHGSHYGIYQNPATRELSLDVFIARGDEDPERQPSVAVLVAKKPNGSTERETWRIGESEFQVDQDRREQISSRGGAFGQIRRAGETLYVWSAR